MKKKLRHGYPKSHYDTKYYPDPKGYHVGRDGFGSVYDSAYAQALEDYRGYTPYALSRTLQGLMRIRTKTCIDQGRIDAIRRLRIRS